MGSRAYGLRLGKGMQERQPNTSFCAQDDSTKHGEQRLISTVLNKNQQVNPKTSCKVPEDDGGIVGRGSWVMMTEVCGLLIRSFCKGGPWGIHFPKRAPNKKRSLLHSYFEDKYFEHLQYSSSYNPIIIELGGFRGLSWGDH